MSVKPQPIFSNTDKILYPSIIEGKNAIGTALREQGKEVFGKAGHVRAGMYAHYYFTDVKTKKKYWIKKVHTPFMTFAFQFREHKGVGETIDREVIDLLKSDDEIFFVYDNAIYTVLAKEFKDAMHNRPNDADQGIQTCSIPICMLKRFI
jgi:hypothetical protein